MQMQQSMQQLQSSGLFPANPMGFGLPSPAPYAPYGGGLDFSSILNQQPAVNPPVAPVDPPATRFASQLAQLECMGFSDTNRNLAVLQQCNGNVNLAVERLLGGN